MALRAVANSPGAGGASRPQITTNTTYYVSTTGSNSNDGLTVGTPFLTIQKAFDVVATIDFNGKVVSVQLAGGAYTVATLIVPVTVGQATPGSLILLGDTTTPSNVVIQGNTGFTPSISAAGGAMCRLDGIQFKGSVANTYGPQALKGGIFEIGKCDFSTNCWIHMLASGGWIYTAPSPNAYTISAGPAWGHALAETTGLFTYSFGSTVTITGSPSWGITAFMLTAGGAVYAAGSNTFSGASTGSRYNSTLNGVINTNGGGASYFPGSTAGTTATGGQYA